MTLEMTDTKVDVPRPKFSWHPTNPIGEPILRAGETPPSTIARLNVIEKEPVRSHIPIVQVEPLMSAERIVIPEPTPIQRIVDRVRKAKMTGVKKIE